MNDDALLTAIAAFVDELPPESAELLAGAIEECSSFEAARRSSAQLIAHGRFTHRRRALLDAWAERPLNPAAVALALRAAARSTSAARAEVRVDPVWTGPSLRNVSFRRSEQALLEVVHAATRHLLVVSYAVYRHPDITQALVDAADAGVKIEIVVESPAESQGRMTADPVEALGPAVTSRCAVLVWPQTHRQRDAAGAAGVLHAKCAVADSSVLLVTSANLTERAMTNNIELGVVVRGGRLAGAIAEAFDELRQRGDLIPVA